MKKTLFLFHASSVLFTENNFVFYLFLFSGVSKQIHTNSSQLTTQIRQSGTSALNDTLVKFILILLCGLLLANSVLFYKMWDLEAKLGKYLIFEDLF